MYNASQEHQYNLIKKQYLGWREFSCLGSSFMLNHFGDNARSNCRVQQGIKIQVKCYEKPR